MKKQLKDMDIKIYEINMKSDITITANKLLKRIISVNTNFNETIACPLTYHMVCDTMRIIIAFNESGLLSNLNEKELNDIKEQIIYFNRNISSYINDMCKDIDCAIKELEEANKPKTLEEMTKEELIAYIKNNNK